MTLVVACSITMAGVVATDTGRTVMTVVVGPKAMVGAMALVVVGSKGVAGAKVEAATIAGTGTGAAAGRDVETFA